MSNERHITINILPQSSEAWFFISVAAALIGCVWGLSREGVAEAQAKASVHANPIP